MPAAAGIVVCVGVCNAGSPGCTTVPPATTGLTTADVVRIAGPGAIGCAPVAAAGSFNWRAIPGVTPTVVAVGRSGSAPTSGRACASCEGSTRCAKRDTGLDPVTALAGTTVAARRLTKLFTETF
jgi:hypothetical protein